MKKIFLLLVMVVCSASLLAQELPPASETIILPDQKVTASYSSAPELAVTWSAELVHDNGLHQYQATVTLQNKTEETFCSWIMTIGHYDTFADVNSSDQFLPVMYLMNISSFYTVLGWTSFEGIPATANQDIAPHGTVTFSYTAQLPEGQTVIHPPTKIMVAKANTFILEPDQASQ